jgi:ATP-dependent Clp protease ATP-binding subunit ClpA
MARARGARNYETLHILYGLCSAEGGFASWLLERSGGSSERVRRIIEKSLSRERPAAERAPVPTVNHEVCVTTSRANARSDGRSTVSEIDLLCAVLQNPSRNVGKVLDAAGCDRAFLAQELGAFGEHSVLRSVSRSIATPPGS